MCKLYILQALTDIWTGDAARNGGRTISTGLLGSIRWWFEVLVRYLGGSACDPTNSTSRCPNSRKSPLDPCHHCVVCELFGCTGWARKFRFEVLDENDQPQLEQIKKDKTFKLRFTELRPVREEEWALLDLTLRLIAECGAIGGKTVLKPSDAPSCSNASHHRDYGLIQVEERLASVIAFSEGQLKDYVQQDSWRKFAHNDFAWASLDNFWCVNGTYLARLDDRRSSFNCVIGRPEPKQDSNDVKGDSWLAGRRGCKGSSQDPESKKVFSFKNPPRTFGFVKPGEVDFDEMLQRLEGIWPDLPQKPEEFQKGPSIFQTLLNAGTRGNP